MAVAGTGGVVGGLWSAPQTGQKACVWLMEVRHLTQKTLSGGAESVMLASQSQVRARPAFGRAYLASSRGRVCCQVVLSDLK